MNILSPENIYHTLTGSLADEYTIPGVENAFAEGSRCAMLYREVYQANMRLCARLGQTDNDPDVEIIVNNLLEICDHLCLKMFDYGQKNR